MKFLKTIRFDPSDLHVFEHYAAQDEWAVAGGFLYSNCHEGELEGKQKQAFSNGFLSVQSFGNSTFVSVAEIDESELDFVVKMLAKQFLEKLAAPSLEEALPVAQEEIQFVCDLCSQAPINSVFAVSRHFDDNQEVCEEFSIVNAPTEKLHTRVWEIARD